LQVTCENGERAHYADLISGAHFQTSFNPAKPHHLKKPSANTPLKSLNTFYEFSLGHSFLWEKELF